jgi:type IV secretory pathway VirB10-like protein
VRSKIWFLVAAACAVIALALGLWWSMGGKEELRQKAAVIKEHKIVPKTEPGECTRHKKTTQKDAPPVQLEKKTDAVPDTTWGKPAQLQEPEPEPELVTIQGTLESMDPCDQTISVDGTIIDVSRLGGSFPMYSTYQIGDFVEVTYREYKAGNRFNSIEIFQKKLN